MFKIVCAGLWASFFNSDNDLFDVDYEIRHNDKTIINLSHVDVDFFYTDKELEFKTSEELLNVLAEDDKEIVVKKLNQLENV
jgi:hypothetical protein